MEMVLAPGDIPILKISCSSQILLNDITLGRQPPDSKVLAHRMQLPETVVGLWQIKIGGDLKMKGGLPLGYWETCDARQCGVVAGIDENGLCVHSSVDMHIGGELSISVFYALGNGFDGFKVLTKIVGKDLCCNEGWEAYEYELEISEISELDCLKLRTLLDICQARSIYS